MSNVVSQLVKKTIKIWSHEIPRHAEFSTINVKKLNIGGLMPKTIFLFTILFSLLSNANSNPKISFHAECRTTPGQLINNIVTIDSEFIWAGYGTDLGPTSIKIIKQEDQKVLMDLKGKDQTFFRETELAIMFFGTYKNVTLTAPNQTVHIIIAYQDFMSLLQRLALAAEDSGFSVLKGKQFILSVFAEEDRDSNMFMQIVCDFTVSK